jgi:two-component system invasion response regulator UvrY
MAVRATLGGERRPRSRVVVDDHAIVRSGLRRFFSEYVDLRVTGEAASAREAIELVRTTELDVLVMDLSMPGQSGIDAPAIPSAL